MIEAFLFTPYVAVQLNVLQIILRQINLVYLDVLFVIHQNLLVSGLIRLEVFEYRVVMLQSLLGDLAILIRFFEQRLEGVVGE